MTLGFSIENPALTDEFHQNILLGNHDSLKKFLNNLKEEGIESIEIRILRREDEENYQNAIQLIWDLGMEITIHGDISGPLTYHNFRELYPSMDYILAHFEKYQEKLVMPIHAYQAISDNEDRAELSEQTVEEFGNWINLIEREGIPLYIALENNRAKSSKVDPGDSIDGVMKMVNQINNRHLGICWDMGHYYSNLLKEANISDLPNETINQLPDSNFIEKVYHTHIHGLNEKGITHFPLTQKESLPLETYISALRKTGYNNTYNLELTLSRWDQEVTVQKQISNTIKRLREAVIT
ncbi:MULTISPECIES: sugar phosphate isomerase/epimerase family protein [Oceanobacillus]|uniref:Xylose isomerase-like TIM barrel domain-containing protein n=1 Tax=Oceanobacillus indicireducens TaxID=1004261 RepID=A0A917XYK0_9BACI|nr:sugar phosphate isomerase/epimerase [Oceanobacillus indicireducens]GGN59831.1 hypothetical protein GCM10007971_23340 [Oceanobacillus indicireducens]